MNNMSSAAQSFNDKGFLALENLLAEEVATISAEVDKVIAGEVGGVPEHDIIYEPNSSPPRVRNIFRLHQYIPFFMETARNPKLVAVVEEIFGRPLRLYASQLFAKPAEVGTAVPMHQDMPYWPFEPYELLSCWIALDDSTLENGCVRYVAGSHKLGILNHVPSGVAGNSLGLDDVRLEGLEEVPVEAPRGSCILHHCLTAHRSEPNRSPNARRGLIYVYMSDRVRLTDPSKLKGQAEFPTVSTV
ncbi:MAG TPA: phytanoyl-CoA dioxygenase family protein [Abditibacteriaceae bacterium]|nr:phytanoyl-CoA dioxygenase family protein [Abditibacteriaceae bacterium]